MREAIGFLAIIGLVACTDEGPTLSDSRLRVAPPTLSVSATSRVSVNAGSGPELEVSASLQNKTKSHIQVAVGAQCPLFVQIFPNPTGEQRVTTSSTMACPSGGPTLDIAPGGSAVLTRVFSAETLASYAEGRYGINVAVTSSTGVLGVWAGAVELPLGSSP